MSRSPKRVRLSTEAVPSAALGSPVLSAVSPVRTTQQQQQTHSSPSADLTQAPQGVVRGGGVIESVSIPTDAYMQMMESQVKSVDLQRKVDAVRKALWDLIQSEDARSNEGGRDLQSILDILM